MLYINAERNEHFSYTLQHTFTEDSSGSIENLVEIRNVPVIMAQYASIASIWHTLALV